MFKASLSKQKPAAKLRYVNWSCYSEPYNPPGFHMLQVPYKGMEAIPYIKIFNANENKYASSD